MNDTILEAILARRKFTHVGSEDAYVKQVMYYRMNKLLTDVKTLGKIVEKLK